MKKVLIYFLIIGLFVVGLFIGVASIGAEGNQESGTKTNMAAARESADRSAVSIPVPNISYFQERRTIAKWAQRWDQPNLPCYVYLISYGNIIGYYVTDGKPSSTNSYLTPEYRESYNHSSTTITEQLPDVDGTYGSNNQGIRFFTAEGTAVEWGGSGASYIYSDAPLPLSVPKLNRSAE
jgi:hypothetical protein